MRYIIVDLEATCRESGFSREKMETIEIGAVELLSADAEPSRAFARFIRPVVEPTLSEFCTKLTGITQREVDRADGFWTVFTAFLDWIGPTEFTLCSWGAYDLLQLKQDCTRHGFPWPETLDNHRNLKKEFSAWLGVKPTGMAGALQQLGLPLIGRHHRGIDDAKNIAEIARRMLPRVCEPTK